MKLIAVCDKNWAIGKNNDLIYSLPLDMKHFRSTTAGGIVVMGKNTLFSFPDAKPLKKRYNVVISTSLERDDCKVVRSVDELKAALEKENLPEEFKDKDVFLIGGASLYKQLLDFCDTAIITRVDAEASADSFIPNLDLLENWELVESGEELEDNGYKIRFCTYKNNAVKAL